MVTETRSEDFTSWTLNRLHWIYSLKALEFTKSFFKREREREKNFRGFLRCRVFRVSQQFDFVWGQGRGPDSGWRWRRTHGDATLECYFFDAEGSSLRTSGSARPFRQ